MDLPSRHDKPSPGNYVSPMTTPTATLTTAINNDKDNKTIVDVVFWELISVEFHFLISVVRDESKGGGIRITGREERGEVGDGSGGNNVVPAVTTTPSLISEAIVTATTPAATFTTETMTATTTTKEEGGVV